MSGESGVTCAAYGCPLLGVYGAGKRWFCFCHFNVEASRNDAITLVLNQNRPLVDQSLSLRARGAGWKALMEVESQLIELTREAGVQTDFSTVGVTGPEYAEQPYAEVSDERQGW